MSFIAKTKEWSSFDWKAYVLPGYITISAIFIVYMIYSFIVWGVYNLGVNSGAQRGYQAAVAELMNQASSKCEPVELTLEDKKIQVVNVACLQQSSTSQTPDTPAQGN